MVAMAAGSAAGATDTCCVCNACARVRRAHACACVGHARACVHARTHVHANSDPRLRATAGSRAPAPSPRCSASGRRLASRIGLRPRCYGCAGFIECWTDRRAWHSLAAERERIASVVGNAFLKGFCVYAYIHTYIHTYTHTHTHLHTHTHTASGVSDTGKTKGSIDELHRHEQRCKRDISVNFTQEISAVFACLVQQETTSIYPLHPTTAGSPPYAHPRSLFPLGFSWQLPVAISAPCFRIACARILPVRLSYLRVHARIVATCMHACMHERVQ